MKTLRRFWWLAGIGALVVALGALLAIPALAATTGQSTNPPSDTIAAMHAACAAGDLEGMQGAMDSLNQEDWQAMEERMNDGQHGSMGSYMAGQGGMMGGQSGRTMMG
ncbi:MAG: hypothetical protein HY533_03320 [Chloroflexi bacterium]|nr:hypothetical protein [Chloroflexota bacterium]